MTEVFIFFGSFISGIVAYFVLKMFLMSMVGK